MRESRSWTVTADDGVRLQAELWPSGRPSAPLVLGLHGITANRLAFLPLIDELGDEVDFLSLDARGRGLSDKPAEPAAYGHRRNAEDAVAVLADLGRGADVVVGQSMGAWVGLQLAAHHPDLVGALVLGDGGYFLDLPADVEPDDYVDGVMGAGWRERLTATVPSQELLFAALQQVPPFRDSWGPGLEQMLAAGLEEAPGGGVRNRCALVAAATDAVDYFLPRERPYVKADLAAVGCPVHLVRAPRGFDISPDTQAPLLSDEAVEAFTRDLPQLVVETVPDTNHYTVNFGAAGVTVLAEAVRKAVR